MTLYPPYTPPPIKIRGSKIKRKPPIVVIKKTRGTPVREEPRTYANRETKAQAILKENPLISIDYENVIPAPIRHAKIVFGSRLTMLHGSYYLDGKRTLVGKLIELSRNMHP